MKGILLISHGMLAKGMYETAKMFYGEEDLKQVDYLSLMLEDSVDSFDERLEAKLRALDDGDGVIILADLFGGSPCNRAAKQLGESTEVISGMNLAMYMELLGQRLNGHYDLSALIQTSKDNILNVRTSLGNTAEDDFFE